MYGFGYFAGKIKLIYSWIRNSTQIFHVAFLKVPWMYQEKVLKKSVRLAGCLRLLVWGVINMQIAKVELCRKVGKALLKGYFLGVLEERRRWLKRQDKRVRALFLRRRKAAAARS